MKKINSIKYLRIFLVTWVIILNGCNASIYEFDGFDGQLSGVILDPNGNFISGDIKSVDFAVHALGDDDLADMILRVNNDGTYANTRLYSQTYKVWLVGPLVGTPTEPIIMDLTGGQTVSHDFHVTPLLTIPAPVLNGNPTTSEIKIDYNITGNSGNMPNLREIYCSTVSWPTRSTGSGTIMGGWFTKIVTVDTDQGTAIIDGLQPNTKYFIRIGARASGQDFFNHSDQISVTTPN